MQFCSGKNIKGGKKEKTLKNIQLHVKGNTCLAYQKNKQKMLSNFEERQIHRSAYKRRKTSKCIG